MRRFLIDRPLGRLPELIAMPSSNSLSRSSQIGRARWVFYRRLRRLRPCGQGLVNEELTNRGRTNMPTDELQDRPGFSELLAELSESDVVIEVVAGATAQQTPEAAPIRR